MEFDFRQYLRQAARWWWLIVIGAMIPAAVSYYYMSQQPPLYQARVIMMVGTMIQNPNPDPGELGTAGQLARTYGEMLRYRPVTSEVIRRLGLEQTPEGLVRQISTGVRPNTNFLELYVTDTNPEAAATIANTLAEELIRQSPASQAEGEQQRFIEERLRKLKVEIEELQAQIDDQKARILGLTSAADILAAQQYLDSLENVASDKRAEYTDYAQVYVGGAANQLMVVEPAIAPTEPLGGKIALIVGIAGLAGVGLALAGVFLIESMDEALRWGSDQADTLFDLPVLGALARVRGGAQAAMTQTGERTPEVEALRALRTTLLLRRQREPYRSLLITSPGSGEGKSYVTSSLGASTAADGLRTVLVDADMRKPSLHEFFDRPNPFGLAELLNATAPIADIESLQGLQATGQPNLWLLPAGRFAADPTGLLMSPNLARLLESLYKHADIVIFDSPPILVMPDVDILASRLDSMAIVVADGVTTRSQLEQVSERVGGYTHISALGVIYNRVKLQEHTYAYYYYRRRSPGLPSLAEAWNRLAGGRHNGRVARHDPDRLLTLAEAADRLGVSKSTARRWSRAGRLPVTRDGLGWRVRRADLELVIGSVSLGRGELGAAVNASHQERLEGYRSLTEDVESYLNVEQR